MSTRIREYAAGIAVCLLSAAFFCRPAGAQQPADLEVVGIIRHDRPTIGLRGEALEVIRGEKVAVDIFLRNVSDKTIQNVTFGTEQSWDAAGFFGVAGPSVEARDYVPHAMNWAIEYAYDSNKYRIHSFVSPEREEPPGGGRFALRELSLPPGEFACVPARLVLGKGGWEAYEHGQASVVEVLKYELEGEKKQLEFELKLNIRPEGVRGYHLRWPDAPEEPVEASGPARALNYLGAAYVMCEGESLEGTLEVATWRPEWVRIEKVTVTNQEDCGVTVEVSGPPDALPVEDRGEETDTTLKHLQAPQGYIRGGNLRLNTKGPGVFLELKIETEEGSFGRHAVPLQFAGRTDSGERVAWREELQVMVCRWTGFSGEEEQGIVLEVPETATVRWTWPSEKEGGWPRGWDGNEWEDVARRRIRATWRELGSATMQVTGKPSLTPIAAELVGSVSMQLFTRHVFAAYTRQAVEEELKAEGRGPVLRHAVAQVFLDAFKKYHGKILRENGRRPGHLRGIASGAVDAGQFLVSSQGQAAGEVETFVTACAGSIQESRAASGEWRIEQTERAVSVPSSGDQVTALKSEPFLLTLGDPLRQASEQDTRMPTAMLWLESDEGVFLVERVPTPGQAVEFGIPALPPGDYEMQASIRSGGVDAQDRGLTRTVHLRIEGPSAWSAPECPLDILTPWERWNGGEGAWIWKSFLWARRAEALEEPESGAMNVAQSLELDRLGVEASLQRVGYDRKNDRQKYMLRIRRARPRDGSEADELSWPEDASRDWKIAVRVKDEIGEWKETEVGEANLLQETELGFELDSPNGPGHTEMQVVIHGSPVATVLTWLLKQGAAFIFGKGAERLWAIAGRDLEAVFDAGRGATLAVRALPKGYPRDLRVGAIIMPVWHIHYQQEDWGSSAYEAFEQARLVKVTYQVSGGPPHTVRSSTAGSLALSLRTYHGLEHLPCEQEQVVTQVGIDVVGESLMHQRTVVVDCYRQEMFQRYMGRREITNREYVKLPHSEPKYPAGGYEWVVKVRDQWIEKWEKQAEVQGELAVWLRHRVDPRLLSPKPRSAAHRFEGEIELVVQSSKSAETEFLREPLAQDISIKEIALLVESECSHFVLSKQKWTSEEIRFVPASTQDRDIFRDVFRVTHDWEWAHRQPHSGTISIPVGSVEVTGTTLPPVSEADELEWSEVVKRTPEVEQVICTPAAEELQPVEEVPGEPGDGGGDDQSRAVPGGTTPRRLAQIPQGALPGCLDTLTTYCVAPDQKLRVPPSSPLLPPLKMLADNPDTPCATVGGFTAFTTYLLRTDEAEQVTEDPGVPVTPQIQELPPDKLSQPQVTENPDGSFDIDLQDAAIFFDLGSRLVELVTSSGGGSPGQGGAGETPLPGSLRQGTEWQSPVTTIDFADPGSNVSIPTSLDRNRNLQANVFVPLDSEQLSQSVGQVADLGLVLRDTVSGTMTAAAPADALVMDEKGRTVGAFFNSGGIPSEAPQAEAILVDRATDLVLARRPLGGQGTPGSAPAGEASTAMPPFTGGTMTAMTDKPHYEPGELVNVQVLLPAGWEKLPGYEAGGFLTISWPEGTKGAFVPAGATEQTVAFPAVGQGAHDVRADLQPMNRATAARPEFADLLDAAREAVDNRRAETEQKLAQLELVRAAEAELAGLPGGGAVPREALDWMNSQLQQERDGLEAIRQGLGD